MADGWRDVTEPGAGPWEGLEPGPMLARALGEADPQRLPDDERASYLAASERLAGWAHMVQARALVAVADLWRRLWREGKLRPEPPTPRP